VPEQPQGFTAFGEAEFVAVEEPRLQDLEEIPMSFFGNFVDPARHGYSFDQFFPVLLFGQCGHFGGHHQFQVDASDRRLLKIAGHTRGECRRMARASNDASRIRGRDYEAICYRVPT